MPSRIFISCGQSSAHERKAAKKVSAWLADRGFEPYVAVEVQTLLDLNSEVIAQLKKSDYFLFINFRREFISTSPAGSYRGSLFTNQELAIAYALEFEHLILLNQKNVRREGLFGYIVSNSPEFDTYSELLGVVQQAITASSWSPEYSRNLFVSHLRCGSDVPYNDYSTETLPGGTRLQRHCLGYIENRRADIGALQTVIRFLGHTDIPSNVWHASPDKSNLKASGRVGYEHTVWPKSAAAFDLFALHLENTGKLFLNSEHDFRNRAPIIAEPGDYVLKYEVFSNGFPLLPFKLGVRLTSDPSLTEVVLDDRLHLVCVPRSTTSAFKGPWFED